jgi:hypothetical protein
LYVKVAAYWPGGAGVDISSISLPVTFSCEVKLVPAVKLPAVPLLVSTNPRINSFAYSAVKLLLVKVGPAPALELNPSTGAAVYVPLTSAIAIRQLGATDKFAVMVVIPLAQLDT